MTQQTIIQAGVGVICLIAFIAVALLSAQIFEHLPHSEDEAAYLFQAQVLAQNRLTVPTPPLPDAFWSPFVLDYQGQRFGKYPIGWPLLLSLGIRLNAPWLVNALLGTITLALIAMLGHCFYSREMDPPLLVSPDERFIPLLAAGLGLVTPGFLFQSASMLSHTASLFWNTLALLGAYYTVTVRQPGRAAMASLAAGLCLGAAFMTRPLGAVAIGLTLGLFLFILTLRQALDWKLLMWLGVGAVAVAAIHPFYWWRATGDATFNAYLLVWPYDRVGFGPDVGAHGYTLYDAIFVNTRLKLHTLAIGLFGWPGWTSLLFLPIPFLAKRANRWDWLLLSTILNLVFVHIFYWAFGGADGGLPRYYYDALPAFLLLTARGILISGDILARWQPPLRWLPLAVVAVFVIYNLVWTQPPLLAEQQGKYGISSAPLVAVKKADLPKPALILVQNVGIWSDFAAPFAANRPTLDGPVIYAIDWGGEYTRVVRAHFANRSCWLLHNKTLTPCPKFPAQGTSP